ncbi:MAG: hypothetical protein OER77_08580 [Myxococcales bacterium]|nr:hypothetical protein [Myxococcales bacterium]
MPLGIPVVAIVLALGPRGGLHAGTDTTQRPPLEMCARQLVPLAKEKYFSRVCALREAQEIWRGIQQSRPRSFPAMTLPRATRAV